MRHAERLLASDLDGTLIAANPGPDDVTGVAAFARAIAAAPLAIAYVTGRHRALALQGVRGAGLPLPDVLCCDVGTSVYHRAAADRFEPDEAFADEMRARLGGIRLDDVRARLSALPFLALQAEERQAMFKLSYDVPGNEPADASARVRRTLALEGLALQVVGSRDPVTGDGLIDILPSGAGKHHTLAFLERRFGLAPEAVVFAGDSGNDREALLGPWPGILVGNAPQVLADELRAESRRLGREGLLYVAAAPGVRGVLEGCRHFGFA